MMFRMRGRSLAYNNWLQEQALQLRHIGVVTEALIHFKNDIRGFVQYSSSVFHVMHIKIFLVWLVIKSAPINHAKRLQIIFGQIWMRLQSLFQTPRQSPVFWNTQIFTVLHPSNYAVANSYAASAWFAYKSTYSGTGSSFGSPLSILGKVLQSEPRRMWDQKNKCVRSRESIDLGICAGWVCRSNDVKRRNDHVLFVTFDVWVGPTDGKHFSIPVNECLQTV